MQISVQSKVSLDGKNNIKEQGNRINDPYSASSFCTIIDSFIAESDEPKKATFSQSNQPKLKTETIDSSPENNLTEMITLDGNSLQKSEEQGITLLYTNHSVQNTEQLTEFLTEQVNQFVNDQDIYTVKEVYSKKDNILLAQNYQVDETGAMQSVVNNNPVQVIKEGALINDSNDINLNNETAHLNTTLYYKAHLSDIRPIFAYIPMPQGDIYKTHKIYIQQNEPYSLIDNSNHIPIRFTLSKERNDNDTNFFQQDNLNVKDKHEINEESKHLILKDLAHLKEGSEPKIQHKINNIVFNNETFEEFYNKGSKDFSLDIHPSKEETVKVKVKFGTAKNSEISISSNVRSNLEIMIKNLDELKNSLEEIGFNSLKFDFHHSNHQEKEDDEIFHTKLLAENQFTTETIPIKHQMPNKTGLDIIV